MNIDNAFDLPIPDDDDTGALALYMQDLAYKQDAAFTRQYQELNKFMSPPTHVQKISSSTGTASPNTEKWVFFSTVFSNITSNEVLAQPGWWHFGVSATVRPTGTVTNNSIRRLKLELRSNNIVPGVQVVMNRWVELSHESSSGSESLLVTGETYVPPNSDPSIWVYLFHDNASNLEFVNGWLWFTWLGYGDATRKVIV